MRIRWRSFGFGLLKSNLTFKYFTCSDRSYIVVSLHSFVSTFHLSSLTVAHVPYPLSYSISCLTLLIRVNVSPLIPHSLPCPISFILQYIMSHFSCLLYTISQSNGYCFPSSVSLLPFPFSCLPSPVHIPFNRWAG